MLEGVGENVLFCVACCRMKIHPSLDWSLLTWERVMLLHLTLRATPECQDVVYCYKVLEIHSKNDSGKVEGKEILFIDIYVNCLSIYIFCIT